MLRGARFTPGLGPAPTPHFLLCISKLVCLKPRNPYNLIGGPGRGPVPMGLAASEPGPCRGPRSCGAAGRRRLTLTVSTRARIHCELQTLAAPRAPCGTRPGAAADGAIGAGVPTAERGASPPLRHRPPTTSRGEDPDTRRGTSTPPGLNSLCSAAGTTIRRNQQSGCWGTSGRGSKRDRGKGMEREREREREKRRTKGREGEGSGPCSRDSPRVLSRRREQHTRGRRARRRLLGLLRPQLGVGVGHLPHKSRSDVSGEWRK